MADIVPLPIEETPSSGSNIIQRRPDGKFVTTPGRKPGSRNKTASNTLAEIRSMGGDAVQALRNAVATGERWAVEYVLNKIVPAGRTFELADVTPGDVIAALKEGDISSEEARDLATAFVRLAEIDALKNIEARLAALEEDLGK